MKIRFELTGLMPLLIHADNVEASDELTAWRRDPKNKSITVPGDDRSPGWTWQSYLTHDGKNVAIPSEYLMVALRQAGAQMILKKQKTFKEISQSGMCVHTEFVEFQGGKGRIDMEDVWAMRDLPFKEQAEKVRNLGFRLFVKRARIQTSKNIRVRPRFDAWRAAGEIVVFDHAQELTYEVVSKLFQLAGRVGIGDWRPGCKTPGPFGMFDATLSKI